MPFRFVREYRHCIIVFIVIVYNVFKEYPFLIFLIYLFKMEYYKASIFYQYGKSF